MDGYSGTAKPCFRRIARARRLGDTRRTVWRPRRLASAAPSVGEAADESASGITAYVPRLANPGLEHERVGDEPANGVSGGRKLRRLRDAVAEHQIRTKRVPQPVLSEHGFGRTAVRSDVGIGDGKTADACRIFTRRPRPSSRSSTVSGEPFGAKITRRPTAYTTPASRVSPAADSRFGNSSSAARNISNGAPSWICRVKVPDAPNTSSTRVPWACSNCFAISVSAKLRFAAAAIVGGRCAAGTDGISRSAARARGTSRASLMTSFA